MFCGIWESNLADNHIDLAFEIASHKSRDLIDTLVDQLHCSHL